MPEVRQIVEGPFKGLKSIHCRYRLSVSHKILAFSINRIGCSGSFAHEPEVTMPNYKCKLKGYKSLQRWAVEQWNCVLYCGDLQIQTLTLASGFGHHW